MDPIEAYEFDRCGYLIIREMLAAEEVTALRAAVDDLEAHALPQWAGRRTKRIPWGPIYHANEERGYHVDGSGAYGEALIIEDFFNADPVFDLLVNHPRTMGYIRGIVQGPVRINNSEIRLRFPGNATGTPHGRADQPQIPVQLQPAGHRLHDGADGLLPPRCQPGSRAVLRRAGHAQDELTLARTEATRTRSRA